MKTTYSLFDLYEETTYDLYEDYFNLFPFTAMKICPKALTFF